MAAEHVHQWKDDLVLNDSEMRCDCGYWRCKYVDKTTRSRCPLAAHGIKDWCGIHLNRRDRQNQLIEASGAAGKRRRRPRTGQSPTGYTPKGEGEKEGL